MTGSPMIFINPGHGGTDTGAVSGAFTEKTLNLTVALYLQDFLVGMGYEVYMTREADVAGGQTNIINQMKELLGITPIRLAVSIHHNAGGGVGCEVFRQAKSDKSLAFANAVNEAFIKTGQVSRGVKTRLLSNGLDYYFFNRDPYELGVPSIITEYAFLDNAKSTVWIDSPKALQNEARAIADGIHEVIGYTHSGFAPVNTRDQKILELTKHLTAAWESLAETRKGLQALEEDLQTIEKNLQGLDENLKALDESLQKANNTKH